MIAATATPSTLITAPDFAAIVRTILRALSAWLKLLKAPQPEPSLTDALLNDIGVPSGHLLALRYS